MIVLETEAAALTNPLANTCFHILYYTIEGSSSLPIRDEPSKENFPLILSQSFAIISSTSYVMVLTAAE